MKLFNDFKITTLLLCIAASMSFVSCDDDNSLITDDDNSPITEESIIGKRLFSDNHYDRVDYYEFDELRFGSNNKAYIIHHSEDLFDNESKQSDPYEIEYTLEYPEVIFKNQYGDVQFARFINGNELSVDECGDVLYYKRYSNNPQRVNNYVWTHQGQVFLTRDSIMIPITDEGYDGERGLRGEFTLRFYKNEVELYFDGEIIERVGVNMDDIEVIDRYVGIVDNDTFSYNEPYITSSFMEGYFDGNNSFTMTKLKIEDFSVETDFHFTRIG